MQNTQIPKPAPPKKPLPSPETLKLQSEIRELTKSTSNDGIKFDTEYALKANALNKAANSVAKVMDKMLVTEIAGSDAAKSLKRMRFDPPEHLMDKPFAEHPALQELAQEKEETQKVVKRNPRRKPVKNNGEKR